MPIDKTIRVLVIDDHPMIRAGLIATISPEPDMEVIASAENGKDGVELYRQHKPDVALMDLKMPDMGGVEAIRAIRADFPLAKIVVLSTYERSEEIYQAMQAGAVTYLLKNTRSEKMIGVIRKVAAGGRPVPPEVAQKLADRMFESDLTNREIEVLDLIARGLRNKEIADRLNITEQTAQSHVKSILAKLSVHDRTEAVTIAIRRGIVHID
jgi:two-component system, NarL family, response regulator